MNEAKPAPSQKPEPERNLVTKPSPAASEPVQGDLWPVAELIALERERIASQDRRTEITRHAIDAGDAADKRQYDYHVEKLRRDDEDRKRRHASGIWIVWALLVTGVVFAGLLCWMLFAGDDTQRAVANGLLETIATGLGGFGIGWALLSGIRRSLSRRP